MSIFDRLQLHYWRHIWDQHAEKETGWEDTLSVKNSGVPVCKIKDFRVPLWLVTERERGLSWLKKTKKVCFEIKCRINSGGNHRRSGKRKIQ